MIQQDAPTPPAGRWHSRLSRSLDERLLYALLFALALLAFCRPVDYIDVWWHLGVGEYIWRHRLIPSVDVFSSTVRSHPWLAQEWLYGVGLYGLYSALGVWGVILLKMASATGALAFQERRLREMSIAWAVRLPVLVFIYFMGRPIWHDRSELVSLFLLCFLIWSLERMQRGALPRRLLWSWPAFFMLWANCHGMFALGLAVAGLFILGSWVDRTMPLKRAMLWYGACIAATIANPYGLRLHLAIIRSALALQHSAIYEWVPTPWTATVFWTSAAALAIALLTEKPRRGERFVEPLLVCAVFTYLAVKHVRGVPPFFVCAFPYAFIGGASRRLFGPVLRRIMRYEKQLVAACALIAVPGVVLLSRTAQGGISAEQSYYAQDACDFIAGEKLPGPYYNDYPFGSYWLWRFKGDPGAFIDGRLGNVEGYDEVLDQILAAQRTAELWNALMDRYGISTAMVRYPFPSHSHETSLFRRYFPRQRWALVYWDDLGLVFVRRLPANRDLIARHEFKVVEPDATLESVSDILAADPSLRLGWVPELQRNLLAHPASRRTRQWLDAITKVPLGSKA